MLMNTNAVISAVFQYSAWVTLAKEGATVVAAIGGLVIAVMGLSTWRRQLRGQDEYQLARRLIGALCKVRESLIRIRIHPAITGEDHAAAEGACIPKDINGYRLAALHAAMSLRRRSLCDAIAELETAMLEAEMLNWTGLKERFKPLDVCAKDLLQRMDMYLVYTGLDKSIGNPEEEKRALDALFGGFPTKRPDDLDLRVQSAVAGLVELLQKHL